MRKSIDKPIDKFAVTKIRHADVIADNYIQGNGPSIEAIRFEKTRGTPKESRLFFRIPGAVSSGAPSSSSLFPSGRGTTSGTRYTTRIDYVFLEWTRINGREWVSREFRRQPRRKGRIHVESRVIGTTRLNAAKLYA